MGVLAALHGRPLHQVYEMRLATHKEDEAALRGQMSREVQGLPQQHGRLVQVDHGRLKAAAEEERPHAGVGGRVDVAQVDAGAKEVGDGEEAVHAEEVGGRQGVVQCIWGRDVATGSKRKNKI